MGFSFVYNGKFKGLIKKNKSTLSEQNYCPISCISGT